MKEHTKLFNKARELKKESRQVDFKSEINVSSQGDWCEIIKDIVAMCNSDGGIIVFGVNDNGTCSEFDVTSILRVDSADITNKIARYTGVQYSDFDLVEEEWEGKKVAVLNIGSYSVPLVFNKQGNYQDGSGKQKSAFAAGTTYFRHGTKSEPGDTDDIRQLIERQLKIIRKSWLSGVKKIIEAPSGYQVKVLPSEVRETTQKEAFPIRITDDPSAPAYKRIDPNVTHPYRQKEVINLLNEALKDKRKVTQHDIQCVRKAHEIENKDIFFYRPKFTSPQFSPAFVEWVIEQYSLDEQFFDIAKVNESK